MSSMTCFKEPDARQLVEDSQDLAIEIEYLLEWKELSNDKLLQASNKALELNAKLMWLSVKIRGEKVHNK